MKEIEDFITKAERFLRSAEHLLALGIMIPAPPGAITPRSLWTRRL